MAFRALIIDDDPGIIAEVADIVESLGHVSESAACMHSARERLATSVYDYILLDLEIPVRAGRNIARIQNGINLLKEIRRTRSTPIIVMTGHGNDGPDQAVEAMRAGATDYIGKPFNRSKRSFDDIIRGVLPASGTTAARRSAEKRKFEGGEMIFYPDRVELRGVKVCGGPECGMMRTILDTLRERRPNGGYKSSSGAELARRAGSDRGQNAAAEAIRGFRQKVQQLLLEELNIECGADDVIENDRRHGYRFSQKIVVRDHDDPAFGPVSDAHDPANPDGPVFGPGIQGHDLGRPPVSDGPASSRGIQGHSASAERGPVNDPIRVGPASGLDDPANHRLRWMREQLGIGRPLRREDLEKQFGVSERTAKRDFQVLRDAGEVEFVGPAKTGYYRLAARRH